MENGKIIEINNKFYQEHSFVMLPSNTQSRLHLVFPGEYEGNGKYTTKDTLLLTEEPSAFGYPAQHLYFLSDEKPVVGDYVRHTNNDIGKVTQLYDKNEYAMELLSGKIIGGMRLVNAKKIIATTDSELVKHPTHYDDSTLRGFHTTEYLPRPSNSSLEAFVREWNAGNKFDKVLIEWLRSSDGYYDKSEVWHWESLALKIAPDNTITINPIQ